jgi:hypothetical protein
VLAQGGTGFLADGAGGKAPSSSTVVYSDMDISPFLEPPHPALRSFKFIAQNLLEADGAGYVKTYLISPGLVYGRVTNILVDHGIQRDNCFIWDIFIKASIARGYKGGYVGEGLSAIPGVHVYDCMFDLCFAYSD